MPFKKLKLYFLPFFIAFITSVAVNNLNKQYLQNHPTETGNTKTIVHEGSIYSIDNSWYIDPILNFIKYNDYTVERGNPNTRVRRTPGYPVFYGLHYILLGEVNTHKIIGITQSFLFALSVVLLGIGVFNFTKNFKLGFTTSVLYSICPYVIGYTYFTITESLYPAFVIFTFYFFSNIFRYNLILNGTLCGIMLGIATMIRPTNILLFVPIAVVLLPWLFNKETLNKAVISAAIIFIGFSIVLAPWLIRNFNITNGEIVPLEKFYHESPMGLGRSQTYLSKWWMCFGNPHPEEMVMNMITSNELTEAEKYDYIYNFINNLPKHVYDNISKEEIFNTLKIMQDCYQEKKQLYGSSIKTLTPQDIEPACEFETKKNFIFLTDKYKEAHPFRYYLHTPIIVRGKEFVLQSFSSMYGSLNPSSGDFNFFQKVIKSFMYGINLILFISLFLNLFIKNDLRLKLFCISFVIILFLVIVNLVHVEARYLLAAYPFLYILLARTFFNSYDFFMKLNGLKKFKTSVFVSQ